MPTRSARRALWYHKSDVTISMRAESDSYIEPRTEKRNLAEKYWKQRSDFLLPHRLWLPLARVAAVMLPAPAVGSIWTPCRPHDPEIAKGLCLYLNSTLGLLTLLGCRDNRKPSYPSFSLDTLRGLRVPDYTAMGTAERTLLANRFDWLQNQTLLPFPQMAEDVARRQIDESITEVLDLNPDWGCHDTARIGSGTVRDR